MTSAKRVVRTALLTTTVLERFADPAASVAAIALEQG
jgi:hypothetical protein